MTGFSLLNTPLLNLLLSPFAGKLKPVTQSSYIYIYMYAYMCVYVHTIKIVARL